MITIFFFFFRMGSISYNGRETHDKNCNRHIIMEIRRTHSIMPGKDMLGADIKKKQQPTSTASPAVIGGAFRRGFFTVIKQKASVADWGVRLGYVMRFHVMNPSKRHSVLRRWRGEKNLIRFWSGRKRVGFSCIHPSWRHVGSKQLLNYDGCTSSDLMAILILRISSLLLFCFVFLLLNNVTNAHFCSCFATEKYQLWKISLKFPIRRKINFRLMFHQNPDAVPFCLSFIVPSLFAVFISFIRWQSTRGCRPLSAAAWWKKIGFQRCILDYTLRSSAVPRLSFSCFFAWFQRIFLIPSVFFSQALVQFDVVLINGKINKVALKERCACLHHEEGSREAGKPVCSEETWHTQ